MAKFVPRERKHRKLAKQKSHHSRDNGTEQTNANALEIVPATKSEKERRRQRLQEELRAQQPDKISGKKRKRLEKYVDSKLKKEENLQLLKKLAAQKVDTSLLQSAKKLGRTKESRKEQIYHALREERAGVDVHGTRDAILYEERASTAAADESGLEDDDDETNDVQKTTPTLNTAASQPASFGSGLKRPLEADETGRPVLKRRKRRNKPTDNITAKTQSSDRESDSELSESAWEGFQSDGEGAEEQSKVDERQEKLRLISQLLNASDSEEDKGSGPGDDDEDDDSDDSSGSAETSVTHSEQSSDEGSSENKPARVSAFKAWADAQRNHALDFKPSVAPTNDATIKAAFKPRAPSPDPTASEMTATSRSDKPAYRPGDSIVIPRSETIQAARMELPVVQEEQRIMEAINNNPVTVVCGATGSGKTTQVPQMLLENGYASSGLIGVTQPRRVAATSVASRVSQELGQVYGQQVAHQVRYDSSVGRNTSVKFMTDGILLREIGQDFTLSKYSAVVIDEAHERSVNTDILIGMLSRIVPLREELSSEDPKRHRPLKLIIMSATLRVTDFIMNDRLFKGSKPPIVQAEGRQYPVTEHFARRTQRDYVAEMVRKVSRGHRKLPPGGMLIFLTGQDEIQTVAKRLKEAFASEITGFADTPKRVERRQVNDYLETEEADDDDSEAEITGLDDDDANDDAEFEVEADPDLPQRRGVMKANVLPLYAALPAAQQMRVFEPQPEGSRQIVLATNVAETSLTIPGIRYVFDCGRSKEKVYDTATAVQEFKVDWISKASASQRMGRAGRTGPGHCYRLYSSAIYEQYFEEHTLPEILRTPIEGTVLQLKNMNVDNVVNFPFPTPPAQEQLLRADRLLKNVGAIEARTGKITSVGTELIHYPVSPRFGKILLLGLRNGVLGHAIALVAGLAVGDLFISEPQLPNRDQNGAPSEDEDRVESESRSKTSADVAALTAAQQRKQAYGRAQAVLSNLDDKSDAIKLLTAVAAHAQMKQQDRQSYCSEYFLREKSMDEAQQLRRQLHNIMQIHIQEGQDVSFKEHLPAPTRTQVSLLRQVVAAGYIDQVAVRADLLNPTTPATRKPRRAIEVAYRTLMPSIEEADIDRSASLGDQEQQRSVYVHSSSVLAKLSISEMPAYIVYSHLSRATQQAVGAKTKRTRLHPLTTIGSKQLAALAEGTPLLEVGKPIGKIEELAGKKRQCWVGVSLRDPAAVGSTGWPLGAWKVIQARKNKDWQIEKVLDRGVSK